MVASILASCKGVADNSPCPIPSEIIVLERQPPLMVPFIIKGRLWQKAPVFAGQINIKLRA
jgi:hypothetical protein